jgi:hypothetical protein
MFSLISWLSSFQIGPVCVLYTVLYVRVSFGKPRVIRNSKLLHSVQDSTSFVSCKRPITSSVHIACLDFRALFGHPFVPDVCWINVLPPSPFCDVEAGAFERTSLCCTTCCAHAVQLGAHHYKKTIFCIIMWCVKWVSILWWNIPVVTINPCASKRTVNVLHWNISVEKL